MRIAITSIDAEGRIMRLASALKKYKLNAISFVTFDETDKMHRRMIVKVEDSKILRSLQSILKTMALRFSIYKNMTKSRGALLSPFY